MTPTTPMKSTIQIAAATLTALLLVTLLPAMSAAANDLRLIDAVQRQDSEAVRMLLLDLDTDEDGIDINTRRADGVTALAWAAHWDDIDTARLLVEAGADPNTANDLDVAPLMLASTNRSLPMVELLLASGADPNHARPNGETALMYAARAGEVQVTRALLEARADINAQTSRGFTPLIFAAAEGHGAVAAVLAETGADLSARTDAIVPKRSGYGRRGATADAEPRRPQGGFTPLLYAAMSGDLETVQVLVSAGADVNETAPDGGTPLLVALMRGPKKVCGGVLVGATKTSPSICWNMAPTQTWRRPATPRCMSPARRDNTGPSRPCSPTGPTRTTRSSRSPSGFSMR